MLGTNFGLKFVHRNSKGGHLAKFISTMPSRYETKEKSIPKFLGKELKLPHSGHILKNRFYKVPMSEYIAVADKNNLKITGVPTKVFANMFEKWAAGGYALISTGAIVLDEAGLSMLPGNLFINEDADTAERRAGFSAIPPGVKRHGALMLGQIMNFGDQMAFCNAVNDDEKEAAFEKTRYAIKYLYESGFDGATLVLVVVPAKVGEKGPDLEKVGTLINALAEAKRAVVPESAKFVLGIKLSTAKLQPFSVNYDDFVKIAKKVEATQFDYIELAGGNYEYPYEKDPDREEFYKKVIDEVKHQVKSIPLFGTGGFRTVSTMEKLLREGKLDGIGLARPSAAEFDFPHKVLSHQIQGAKWNPFEQDMETSVLAGAAQMNQAGLRSLQDSNGAPNYGVMDLTDERTLENFTAAKKIFLEKAEQIKKQEQWAWGVVVLTT